MRKKFSLVLLLWVAGTVLAFMSGATLGEYTVFSATLLSAFGVADLVDKKLPNRDES